jgi:hypothetical protein
LIDVVTGNQNSRIAVDVTRSLLRGGVLPRLSSKVSSEITIERSPSGCLEDFVNAGKKAAPAKTCPATPALSKSTALIVIPFDGAARPDLQKHKQPGQN